MQSQPTSTDLKQTLFSDDIGIWIQGFLVDRHVQNIAKTTMKFYAHHLSVFNRWCDSQSVKTIQQITPTVLREFLLYLETEHNPGGVKGFYQVVKTFLRWFENETETDWKNPIRKVKPPKVPLEILEPADISDVFKMMESCSDNLTGKRDKSIMFFLLDTGVRASELLDVLLDDVNPITGDVIIRHGKGRKPRVVFLGNKSRKVLRIYLRERAVLSHTKYLWINDDGFQLQYFGLRMMLSRRAKKAGVVTPTAHSFRRWFALKSLNSGMDLISLQRLMGHSDLSVLNRYLKQTTDDLKEAHLLVSPVDNL